MLSVSYAGKNAYSAGKTSGVLRGGASGANRCYVLAHCAPPPYWHPVQKICGVSPLRVYTFVCAVSPPNLVVCLEHFGSVLDFEQN